MRIPGLVWLRWFSQTDARPGVFSHSPSLVAVTQEALSFHYPAFPRQLLSQTEVYGNTAAESSPGFSFMNQWNMLQTLHPETPFLGSTLAFNHNSLLSSYKTQRRGLNRSLWLMGMYWLARKKLWKECYYHYTTLIYINRAACKVPHDLEAQIQKDVWWFVSRFLLTNSL